jgi:hypothetical protein
MRLVALAVPEQQKVAAAFRKILEEGIQIALQVRFLLARCQGLGHVLQDRGVDNLVQLPATVPPVEQALVAEGPCQPGIRVPDGMAPIDKSQKSLLQEILSVLLRNTVTQKEDPNPRPDPLEEFLEGLLSAWTVIKWLHLPQKKMEHDHSTTASGPCPVGGGWFGFP